MATGKRGCCLATENINEEISKFYLGKKKCFGKTSGLGINVHQNSVMKHAEYIITKSGKQIFTKKKYQICDLLDIFSENNSLIFNNSIYDKIAKTLKLLMICLQT